MPEADDTASAGVNLPASMGFEYLDPPGKWISSGEATQTYQHHRETHFLASDSNFH